MSAVGERTGRKCCDLLRNEVDDVRKFITGTASEARIFNDLLVDALECCGNVDVVEFLDVRVDGVEESVA